MRDGDPGTDAPEANEGSSRNGRMDSARARNRRRLVVAEQELRLMSALVVLFGVGLFLALPFVLSIGSVVFLPLVTAVLLTILLSPLADRFARPGCPTSSLRWRRCSFSSAWCCSRCC